MRDNKKNILEKPFEYFIINNRRYLGSKTKILEFIQNSIDKHIKKYDSFLDIFSGTGVVANHFNKKNIKIITNDMLFSNYIIHYAFFSDDIYDEIRVLELLDYLNNLIPTDNYFSESFGDKFFSLEVSRKIGAIREEIEKVTSKITKREKYILITSLIYSIDKIANTCGHYDAFKKTSIMQNDFKLKPLSIDNESNVNNIILNADANKIIADIEEVDILYLDPPYNSRQYISAYHLIENLAKWDKPEVEGVASKMVNRKEYNSDYCLKTAINAFGDLINKAKAKYIILSYSDMAKKGNDRSNARMSDAEIIDILEKKGKVFVESIKHKPFSTGKTNLSIHNERLFICQTY
ncbi:DNA adenine methylase [Sulfurimonas sp.]|jgi:adenine-specific DNA-methyltransferase|uniref:DNA adenine methylase n=1 Tax=Sulfurimonas sp. TaxID=2022749 RepID=UPI0025ECAB16|nr:DNA adenine methylase [Sulfurimonas sp.]MCK9472320.1 DNA adenine methylase [Sulfurimonas sp.]MDD3505277.1 DNA adenine methylase [Sulfurimonas sp.]